MPSLAPELIPSQEHDLPSLPLDSNVWQRWLATGVSLALLLAIAVRFRSFGFSEAIAVLPRTPAFWITFAAYYLALPASEWIIFNRLWKLPAFGIIPLIRKLVSNEVLLGYSGEVYFYTWARRHTELTAAPFGAIKDVSIASALAGNIATLVMCALSWPFIGNLAPAAHGVGVIESAGVLLAGSLAILLFRHRVFSLDARQLGEILGVHLMRLVVTTILAGMLWHFALPEIHFGWLVLLATLQLLVTRLPFVPSKDLVFANLAVLLVGNDGVVAVAVTMIAAALVMTHLVLGALLLLPEMLGRKPS
jgi:hypothetical protein